MESWTHINLTSWRGMSLIQRWDMGRRSMFWEVGVSQPKPYFPSHLLTLSKNGKVYRWQLLSDLDHHQPSSFYCGYLELRWQPEARSLIMTLAKEKPRQKWEANSHSQFATPHFYQQSCLGSRKRDCLTFFHVSLGYKHLVESLQNGTPLKCAEFNVLLGHNW